jgi:hypothetical protein
MRAPDGDSGLYLEKPCRQRLFLLSGRGEIKAVTSESPLQAFVKDLGRLQRMALWSVRNEAYVHGGAVLIRVTLIGR